MRSTSVLTGRTARGWPPVEAEIANWIRYECRGCGVHTFRRRVPAGVPGCGNCGSGDLDPVATVGPRAAVRTVDQESDPG